MGLPLFVAPVESDLAHKSADKSGSTSPSRSGIRRFHRIDSARERRAASRRQVSIRDRFANSASRPLRFTDPPDVGTDSTGNDNVRLPRPFREVLRDVAGQDWRRERLEEQITSLFGSSLNREPGLWDLDRSEPEGAGWWAFESRPPPSTSPLPKLGTERTQEERPAPRRTVGASPLGQGTTLTSDPSGVRLRRREGMGGLRNRTLASDLESRENRRNALLQRLRTVDGLGDRERSLSPELVWDTLLTTVTPDPQPPSAGSSFASIAASQGAGASPGTALTTPDVPDGADGTAADQACESGCENSDTEGPDYEHPDFARIRRRRDAMRRVRVSLPDYTFETLPDGRLRRRSRPAGSEESSSRQQRRRLDEGLGTRQGQAPGATEHGAIGADSGASSLSPLRGMPEWVGHFSTGNSDDEQGPDRATRNRERSTAPGSSASPAEEDWVGMQRIVRSLARREDIPDEWWAEAGLSRTLPQDGTE